jgi:hypothetical protein
MVQWTAMNSWYLEKSENESEEGLDEDLMAYVHQAEEILKDGANLLQKHQTMKTEVQYGDMVSSHEYAKSSDPHEHNTFILAFFEVPTFCNFL